MVLRIPVFQVPGVDASAHTSYVVDPRAMLDRFARALYATGRTREGARVGFVVPARLAYLAFGAVPGFVVFRYVLALVAVVPAYLLLKRCYGAWAGALAVCVVVSCPVVIVAWGTDYPDSAALSYLIALFACLGLALESSSSRARMGWLVGAGAAATLASWSLAECAVYSAGAVAAYLVVRALRARWWAGADLAIVAVTGLAVTGVLVVASGLVVGQWDFISVTWHSIVYFAQPAQQVLWHSRSWHWLGYDTYLLVPPTVVAAFGVVLGRRVRDMPPAVGFAGLAAAAEVALAFVLQFAGGAEALETHYWSSLVWAGPCIALAMVLAALSAPIVEQPRFRAVPALLVVLVALAYESDPHVPGFTWVPAGIVLALAVLVIAGGCGIVAERLRGPAGRAALAGVGVVAAAGGLLVLTVTPIVAHRHVPGTVLYPEPAYAQALGGSDADGVAWYRVTTSVPGFVGPPPHDADQLLMWFRRSDYDVFPGAIGIYHGFYDSVPGGYPRLSRPGLRKIEARHPGQILVMSSAGIGIDRAMHALRRFHPRMVRHTTLSSGPASLTLWLVDLRW